MGIFRKFGEWLSDKSDRFIRGDAGNGYYASAEDQQAYGGMDSEEENVQSVREPLDPFGNGEGEYGGRVPYRSRYDVEREQQAMQQSVPQQAPQMQQPVPQQTPQMQQPAPQQVAQPQPGFAQQAQSSGNVVTFPGMQASPDGSVYAHVEYVVLLRSRNECKDVIAYIKANASVFLNMEFIASDSERQRCVDMLSGAAYTLGCSLNKISPRGIYLISSPSVRVVLDPAMQKFTSAPEAQGFVRQRYDQENNQGAYYQNAPEQPQESRPQTQGGFAEGSPTMRFQAQSLQQTPSSFGSVMAGNATGMYQPVAPAGRYNNMQQ